MHNLQGRSIEPQRAKARGSGGRSRGGGGGGGSRKLYLGGLDDDLAESDIRDHFSAFGNVSISVLSVDLFHFPVMNTMSDIDVFELLSRPEGNVNDTF